MCDTSRKGVIHVRRDGHDCAPTKALIMVITEPDQRPIAFILFAFIPS
jgi:hypothetical protein